MTCLSGETNPVLDSQCQVTVEGPLEVISTPIVTTCGNASQAKFRIGGSTRTRRPVTMISGGFTTGSDCTAPTVLTKSAESQQEVEGSLGLRTYHQVES